MRRLLVIPIVAVFALVVGATYGLTIGNGRSDTQIASNVPSEGIDVHGDWKIAIYNEDGSLDHEYAFSNALSPGAATLLGALLAVDDAQVGWLVDFGATDIPNPGGEPVPGVSPCVEPVGASPGTLPQLTTACRLAQGGDPFGVLTKTPITDGLRLSGSATATQAGSIDYVQTVLVTSEGSNGFTGTAVGPFTDIGAGQSIQVEVEITFATPAP